MNRAAADYVDQMREHTRHALALAEGLGKDDFRGHRRTYQSVLMSLLIVGKPAAKLIELYPDVIADHAAVPWRSMRGMRNCKAHDYFSIDLDIVWETVQDALPRLRRALDTLE